MKTKTRKMAGRLIAAALVLSAGLMQTSCWEEQHQGVTQYRDREIHLISAGHYATETFGADAVGKLIAKNFNLPYEFIDLPTGL